MVIQIQITLVPCHRHLLWNVYQPETESRLLANLAWYRFAPSPWCILCISCILCILYISWISVYIGQISVISLCIIALIMVKDLSKVYAWWDNMFLVRLLLPGEIACLLQVKASENNMGVKSLRFQILSTQVHTCHDQGCWAKTFCISSYAHLT